ncbi:putative transcription factor MYB family [Rosa chinensis]|uniref:Putative transcription factor MYB family n=1 Tax=Rosa chinensis TaxID=74649 RepID=A0A2P6RWQ2_ROSCH|nr:trihelix transcription factor ASIL2 [Rosa chinensis]XP_024178742.1 trihelix transcription factor ASIL2 [Rosa chinensis]XP_024178743.1 trihelix transcription factor ASIL2 [Rosa chinensis]PRQ50853.1 putative transcription factor MYB family [Rosa chinensis]
MDDTEDDARYPPNVYGANHPQGYDSAQPPKLPARSGSFSRPVSHYDDDEDDEDEELGEEEGHNGQNGYPSVHKDVGDDDDDDDEEGDDDEDEDDEEDDKSKVFKRIDDDDLQKHPKKRKLKSLISSYEFAPRVPAPLVPALPAPRQSHGGRNALTDWTEHETFVLLDAWGDRFLRRGKKSLRSEEWQEVAEKVSEVSKIERTDTQCRNRLDTLKKKYKKERVKFAETGGAISKWVYFKKMDMLMSSPQQQAGLSCGLDSGEYVFMNPRVYLNRANGLDEMRDSPGNSESAEGVEDESDGLPPKKRRFGRDNDERSSFRLLADSIQKFSDIYEKIEKSKRQQMVELEKMRMDFHRDLEMQKRQIMERAQAEIAKMRQADDEENDVSAENASG